MSNKNVQYAKEQNEIIEKIKEIVKLDEEDSFFYYDIKHNQEIETQIYELIDDIKIYFNVTRMRCIKDIGMKNKPHMKIITQFLKYKYNVYSRPFKRGRIQSMRYYVTNKYIQYV